MNDVSGTVTCLGLEGQVMWTNALARGPSKAAARTFLSKPGDLVLAPSGSTLSCCDASGHLRWQTDLAATDSAGRTGDAEILTRPEVAAFDNQELILCGTAGGKLFALDLDGKIVWRAETGETFSRAIRVVPRRENEPLILFTGLWGNLYAFDIRGHHLWTHHFRAKVRGAPLVIDVDADGHSEIFIPTFSQHVYEFSDNGQLKDDIRLSGILPSPLALIRGTAPDRPDLLVTTSALLAYRLRPGRPKSLYGKTGEPREVRLLEGGRSNLILENPNGALLRVEVSLTNEQGQVNLSGQITARSLMEVPLPMKGITGQSSCRATVQDASGRLLAERQWTIPADPPPSTTVPAPAALEPDTLRAWPTAAYGSFDESRLTPEALQNPGGNTNQVSVDALYLDEADEGAFVVSSARDTPTRARIGFSLPLRTDGTAFRGSVVLRQVIPTGSVNGEQVPDALPAIGDSGLVTIPARGAAKLWVSVDTRGTLPGVYQGLITIRPFSAGLTNIELPLRIEVLNLRLPDRFPLTLCTWDYVPNRWFQSRSKEVLDDMSRHGVNVFPRSIIPPARVDEAAGLSIDWTVLEAELARLEHRGKILFQLGHPPIEFANQKTPEEKRPVELDYIRRLRDHLQERGWNYADYAFYLLDEPGLDYGTNVPVLLDSGALFREADPKLQTYTDPVPGLSWKDFERIQPLVDIWAPNMRLVSGLLSGDPRIKQIMTHKTVWSYECVAQVKSISPLRYNRANAWRAKFFGLSGIGFWTHSQTEADMWVRGKTFNDEYALVYPGDAPVPSARWEAVRDGLEDVAAIGLLEEQIQNNREARTHPSLVRESEEALRIALKDIMELSDEAFIESRDFLREGDRVLGHTATDAQIFQRHRAEIARLTLALSSAGP